MPGGKEGLIVVHADLFKAAAEEPLVEIDGELNFIEESFFQRLLYITKEVGHA